MVIGVAVYVGVLGVGVLVGGLCVGAGIGVSVAAGTLVATDVDVPVGN
jgi:hypothetical protein